MYNYIDSLNNNISAVQHTPFTLNNNNHLHVHVYIHFFYRILNKLTPDNFEKLSLELARHAGINNKEILKGAILLVSL